MVSRKAERHMTSRYFAVCRRTNDQMMSRDRNVFARLGQHFTQSLVLCGRRMGDVLLIVVEGAVGHPRGSA